MLFQHGPCQVLDIISISTVDTILQIVSMHDQLVEGCQPASQIIASGSPDAALLQALQTSACTLKESMQVLIISDLHNVGPWQILQTLACAARQCWTETPSFNIWLGTVPFAELAKIKMHSEILLHTTALSQCWLDTAPIQDAIARTSHWC